MENTQTPAEPTQIVSTSATKPRSKIWKIVSIILIAAIAIFALLAWYGFYLENNNIKNNISNNMDTLTTEKIKNLPVEINVGQDNFTGSVEERNKIVDMFVNDNSASDSVHLYIAANTAQLLDRPKDAMFLFFAAQLRKSLDYKRFDLGEADGNNIQTYLTYLNEGAGLVINPLAIQNPELFSEAIRMIEAWNVVPADDALYPKEEYGEVKIVKDQWSSSAKQNKDSFLKDFAYKQESTLRDPKMLEALRFLQDYNFGKIPHNPENDKKYTASMEIFKNQ